MLPCCVIVLELPVCLFQEMLGELFTPVETPEAPNRGFFKGLFGGGAQSLDREELCTLTFTPKIHHPQTAVEVNANISSLPLPLSQSVK